MYCEKCGNKLIDDTKFCNKCGFRIVETLDNESGISARQELPDKRHNRKVLWIVFAVIGVFILIVIFSDSSNNSANQIPVSTPNMAQSTSTQQLNSSNGSGSSTILEGYNQDSIVSSVVNIMCDDENGGSGGSGTIIDSTGMILTNNHIIPQDKKGKSLVENCIVTLPDAQGKVKEIYYGEPIIVPSLSKEYDLAFIKISSAYTDDTKTDYGVYPNTFPSFLPDGCENDDTKLGEKVTVFGYPAISGGGYYLTITDGIVSSLPNDGTIVTSAKVDHGSSGGLAVDRNGCMIGIPAMISGDENESLGVIISNNVIMEFVNKLQTLLNK